MNIFENTVYLFSSINNIRIFLIIILVGFSIVLIFSLFSITIDYYFNLNVSYFCHCCIFVELLQGRKLVFFYFNKIFYNLFSRILHLTVNIECPFFLWLCASLPFRPEPYYFIKSFHHRLGSFPISLVLFLGYHLTTSRFH